MVQSVLSIRGFIGSLSVLVRHSNIILFRTRSACGLLFTRNSVVKKKKLFVCTTVPSVCIVFGFGLNASNSSYYSEELPVENDLLQNEFRPKPICKTKPVGKVFFANPGLTNF